MKTIQPYIPNILTILRMILTPIIIVFGIFKQIYVVIILAIIAVITDFLDGYLARKWDVVSSFGAKLDTVADKLFAIGIVGCLITQFTILWVPFILEIILGATNLFYHFKSKKTETLMIGKFKMSFLFATVIVGILTTFSSHFTSILFGMVYATVNLQILSIFQYGFNFFCPKEDISIESNAMHQQIMKEEDDEELAQTIILEDLQKIAQEYQYNNETDDIS